jgi:hypothetical protein
MPREKHPPDTVIKAIRQHHGLLAPAAKMLGYDRVALYQYVKRHELQWVIDEAREDTVDWAENALFEQARGGNLTAIIFLLKCLGKSRGYVERIPVRVTPAEGESAASDDEEQVITIDVRNGTNGHHD